MMFQVGSASLPWGAKGEYVRERIALYYCSSGAEAMPQDLLLKWLDGGHVGEQGRSWKKETFQEIDAGRSTLGRVLRDEMCVIPGLPTVYALSRGNEFHGKFVSGDW